MCAIFSSEENARAAGATIVAAGTMVGCDPIHGFVNMREQLLERVVSDLPLFCDLSDAEIKEAVTSLFSPFFDYADGQKFQVTYCIGEIA